MRMMGFSSAALCILLLCAVKAEKATFRQYQVHRLIPTNEEQLNALRELEDNSNEMNFWIGPSYVGKAIDVMVPPHELPHFKEVLENLNLKSEIYIEDVQKLVDIEELEAKRKSGFGWTAYYTLNEVSMIYAWLDSLVATYPGIVTPIVGGRTYQGREIRGVKLSFKAGNPGVFIESGIHAREWITPATVTYILNKLLTSDDPVIKDLAHSFDYYVFPSFNPDGYVYTHTTNRMWRKTRSPSSSLCYGADPNRNWDFHWRVVGASSSPCSDTYAGSSAASEIETQTLAAYITSIVDKFDVYFAFHSYSQLLLLPYGHSQQHVSNYNELLTLGRQAATALAKNNGTRYTVGNIYDTIYPAAGGSMDWVRGKFDKPYTYTWELRDTGRYGFLLPPNQIIDTAEETLNSVVVILQQAKSRLRGN
ncbi:Zinc carboxypeptidase A 1 [Blattella germanica]|nr:Zinc carboxypeptidase A 1 [Blattella germanica]